MQLKDVLEAFGKSVWKSLYDKTKNHQNQDSSYQQNQNYNQSHHKTINNSKLLEVIEINVKEIQSQTPQNNQSFDQYEYQSFSI